MQFDILINNRKVASFTGAIHHNLQLSPGLPLSGPKAKRRKGVSRTRMWEIGLEGVNPTFSSSSWKLWSEHWHKALILFRYASTVPGGMQNPTLVTQIIVSLCRTTTPVMYRQNANLRCKLASFTRLGINVYICTKLAQMWQPLAIGLAHLPRTLECLAAGFEVGRVTCFEAARGCALPGAEMAVWGRKMVTLHYIVSLPGQSLLGIT